MSLTSGRRFVLLEDEMRDRAVARRAELRALAADTLVEPGRGLLRFCRPDRRPPGAAPPRGLRVERARGERLAVVGGTSPAARSAHWYDAC